MQDEPNQRRRLWIPSGRVQVKPPLDSPKDISGCAIVGICCQDGERIDGRDITASIATMHERANGLGGGFAAYGIYGDWPDHYALHLMYSDAAARRATEEYLGEFFEIRHQEPIPTRPIAAIRDRPVFQRYFVTPRQDVHERYYDLQDDDIVVMAVMHINVRIEGAFVFSSGKDMGVFKGVGYPEEIAEFFRIEEYRGYLWTAHGRFPTNTTGWWGGAHPFGILDWTVVHNGEISSYGTNRRYLANFGYLCALQTDTEVVAYLFDLLIRKHGLPVALASMAFAPPLWEVIDKMPPRQRDEARAVRLTYGPALLNGPFSVLVGFRGGMIALNDRVKLRPMVAARDGRRVYVASEESAIRAICPQVQEVRQLAAGEPLVCMVDGMNDSYVLVNEREYEAMAGTI